MIVRRRAAALLAAAALAACNSGKREGGGGTSAGVGSGSSSKVWYGPGSTGAGVGSFSGGATGLGQFVAGPDLNTARGQAAATLLKDGRVLVTGGFDGQRILASSEVFDPQKNAWTAVDTLAPTPDQGRMMITDAAGSFASVRRHHTAVALLDGTVLVAGGHGVERRNGTQQVLEAMRTAFLFDPATHAFTQVDSLGENRFLHQAAALHDGRGAVEGGVGLPNPAVLSLTTLEVFDPLTGKWTVHQVSPRSAGVGLTIPGKGALFYGGSDVIDYVGQQLRALVVMNFAGQPVEVFEAPLDRVHSATSTFPRPRMDVGGVMTSNGFAFFAGGRGQSPAQAPPLVLDDRPIYDLTPGTPALEVLDTTERYDVASDRCLPGPKLQQARWGCQLAELGMTSDVLIVGGLDANNALLGSCEVYSVRWDTILGTVDLATPRMQFRALTLRDGRVMVVGGLDANAAGIASCEFHVR